MMDWEEYEVEIKMKPRRVRVAVTDKANIHSEAIRQMAMNNSDKYFKTKVVRKIR
jgi:hypothetical protein